MNLSSQVSQEIQGDCESAQVRQKCRKKGIWEAISCPKTLFTLNFCHLCKRLVRPSIMNLLFVCLSVHYTHTHLKAVHVYWTCGLARHGLCLDNAACRNKVNLEWFLENDRKMGKSWIIKTHERELSLSLSAPRLPREGLSIESEGSFGFSWRWAGKKKVFLFSKFQQQ